MDKKIHHPNEDCLRSFALGTLDEATTSFIRQHLEICNHCAHSMEKSVAAFNPILAQEPTRKTGHGESPSWASSWAMNKDWQKGAAKGLWPVPPSQSSATTASTITTPLPDTVPSLTPLRGSAEGPGDFGAHPIDPNKSMDPPKTPHTPSAQVPDWATQIPLARDGSSVSLHALSPALLEQKQYRIVRRLGESGFGTVYLAHNLLFDREEALKVIPAERVEQLGGPERFLAEMDAASRLNHPHIVASHGAMRWDNLLVFCMEFVAGENLAAYVERYLKEKGPFPVANACYYGYQTALGLQYAHENGMVHRDIKPNNLMLLRKGHRHIVKILDFGLAMVASEHAINQSLPASTRALPAGGGTNIQSASSFPGTLYYLAPEQIGGAEGATIQADVYSLGCTLYHLLCGHPPYEGGSAQEILDKHMATEAPRIDDLRPDVPYQVASIIRRMMSKDPAKRYETPAEVAQALTPFFKPDPPSKRMDAVVLGSSHVDEPPAPASSGPDLPTDRLTKARPKAAFRKAGNRGLFQAMAAGGVALVLVMAVVVGTPRFGGWLFVPPEPKLGIVAIEGVPPGAVFHLDGVMVSVESKNGKVEIPMDADKDHLLEIKKEGFETWSHRIVVNEGSRKSVKAQLPVLTRPPERPKVGPVGKGTIKKDFISQTIEPRSIISQLLFWQEPSSTDGASGSRSLQESKLEPDARRGLGPANSGMAGESVERLP